MEMMVYFYTYYIYIYVFKGNLGNHPLKIMGQIPLSFELEPGQGRVVVKQNGFFCNLDEAGSVAEEF